MKWALACLIGLAAIASCSTSAGPGIDAAAANKPSLAAQGLGFAQQTCAACHAVTAAQPTSPNPNAPTFVAIANLPGMTQTALSAWLLSAHVSMPIIPVGREDQAGLYAYLETLRQRRNAL
jgi:mono/diheme cytochrome c family protein